MTKIFWGQASKGNLSMGSEYNRARFKDFLLKNEGVRLRIDPHTPESRKQRNFFEGAVIPLITFYQEGYDHRETDDCRKVRGWLLQEFWAEMVIVGGKAVKVAKSTKNELNRGCLEAILDWMNDQGYQTELLNPEDYKKWRDKIFPFGGPENYIDYLVEIKKLKPLNY